MDAGEQQRVFDAWLEKHRGLFFKVTRAYAFNVHDRVDLFQEIVNQVWHSIPKFRGDSAETTWSYRVALYSAMAWSKKERRHRDNREPLEGHEHRLLQPAKNRNPRLDWLHDRIAAMDEVDRSLTLLLLEGFS